MDVIGGAPTACTITNRKDGRVGGTALGIGADAVIDVEPDRSSERIGDFKTDTNQCDVGVDAGATALNTIEHTARAEEGLDVDAKPQIDAGSTMHVFIER